METGRIIDLKDLLKTILLRWRILLLAALIAAFGLNSFGIYRSWRKKQNSQKVVSEESQIDAYEAECAALESVLTQREIEEVNNTVSIYASYKENYEKTQEYNETSIRMQLDANRVPTAEMNFYINNHFATEYPVMSAKDNTSDIIVAITDLLCSEEIYQGISDELNLGLDASYVQELIGAYAASANLLCVTVNYTDQETTEAIAAILKSKVDQIADDLQTIYGAFDITESSYTYSERMNSALLTEQQSKVSALNNIRTTMANLPNTLTDDQKAYYELLVNHLYLTEEQEEAEDSVTENKETESVSAESEVSSTSVKLIHKKYLVIGFALGFILMFCWYALLYLLSNRLHIAEEVTLYYQVPVLGQLHREKKTLFGAVDRLICRIFDPEYDKYQNSQILEMVAANILLDAERSHMQTICLTGSVQSDATGKIMDNLAAALEKAGKKVIRSSHVAYSAEALRQMAGADGVVLIEQIHTSRYPSIGKEAELCAANNVRMLGSVIVE
jgi:capsular polysaccharide biosynthesis protein